MGAGKSEIHQYIGRADRLETQEIVNVVVLCVNSPEQPSENSAGLLCYSFQKNAFFGTPQSLFLKPFTVWLSPTHIVECNLI